jgi:AraC-like DNA-binding protein
MHPLGFDIISVSEGPHNAYDSTVPHRHTFFELFLFVKGGGSHTIDFKKFPIEANSVHFISPGQIHQLHVNEASGYVTCFNEDFVPLRNNESFARTFLFYDSPGTPFLDIPAGLCAELQAMMISMKKELGKKTPDMEILRTSLRLLLLKLRAHFLATAPARQASHPENRVTRFKKLIEQHYLRHLPIARYADMLAVTPNYLNALCRKHEGKTAIRLVQERVLLEARRMMYATDLHINEISGNLRFADVSYFNRFFRKHTGHSPTNYRKKFINR